MAGSLYFIAIVPPDPLLTSLSELKEEVALKFESKAALKSPPHITLHMPFKWPDKKLPGLITSLTGFFNSKNPVPLKLDGFGSFPPRVIFVKVEPDPDLSAIQRDLCRLMAEKLSVHNANYRDKPFHPHITIAFRDLKKAIFYKAWDYYSSRLFKEEFMAERVTLLKHNGQLWTQQIHYQLGIQ